MPHMPTRYAPLAAPDAYHAIHCLDQPHVRMLKTESHGAVRGPATAMVAPATGHASMAATPNPNPTTHIQRAQVRVQLAAPAAAVCCQGVVLPSSCRAQAPRMGALI